MTPRGARRERIAALWQWCDLASATSTRRVGLFVAALAATGFASLPMAVAGAPSATGTSAADGQYVVLPAAATPEITEVVSLIFEVDRVRFSQANLDGSLISEEGERFRLAADVLFRFDRADLSSKADGVLADLAAQLTAAGAKKLRIDGYTDATGDAAYNKDLSQRRAETVRARLRAALGSTVAMTAKGHGEQDPVADNDSKDGQARNRRVTVTIVR